MKFQENKYFLEGCATNNGIRIAYWGRKRYTSNEKTIFRDFPKPAFLFRRELEVFFKQ